MGYIRNHAIVVTGTYGGHVYTAHALAVEIFGNAVSSVTPPAVNHSESFFVAPDGSKDGWDESDDGNARRDRFKNWLRSIAYEDGSSPLSWVELYFGGDDNEASVIDHSSAGIAEQSGPSA